ncbi:hypothetical protein DL546_008364 [Coniochaeta pulveracea]|uniref:Uncharacterized protein n=1 Tax=Coniochaeta pulveracea TaxID=177199 RepID=A0A420YCJ0_9PEZI|nr:hypothetical protein DL546_008364 [Coniochaeta pulveracea]
MSAANTDATPGSAASLTPDPAEPEAAESLRWIRCHLCDKSRTKKFYTAWALQKHLRREHCGEEDANLSLEDLGTKYELPISLKQDGFRRSSHGHPSRGDH